MMEIQSKEMAAQPSVKSKLDILAEMGAEQPLQIAYILVFLSPLYKRAPRELKDLTRVFFSFQSLLQLLTFKRWISCSM